MLGSRNRSRRESREAVVASLPVDEDGNVPEDFLRRRNNLRSARSRAADDRSTARKVYPRNMPPEQAVSWIMNPGRSDVEGIDCDGKANVKRREPKKAKAKGKEKPATPKAKAPAKPKQPVGSKPKAPAPRTSGPKAPRAVQTPSVVVSGKEILDVVKLVKETGGERLPLGYGGSYANGSFSVRTALVRGAGRGLFGLDPGISAKRYVDIGGISGLDAKSVYKLSIENDALTFRKGPDFSEASLSVPVIMRDYEQPIQEVLEATHPTHEFSLDSATFARVLRQMRDVRTKVFQLESSSEGTFVTTWGGGDCHIKARIGGAATDPKATALFSVDVLQQMNAVGQNLYVGRFSDDYFLVLEGSFGDYALYLMVSAMMRE